MNRTDRLFAIILELQRKKGGYYSAKDLAEVFEVNQRTIYRDMLALREAGVPIFAIQKKGYSLTEDYFLPPLQFTAEEALIVALGSDFIGRNFDDQYRLTAKATYRKIDAALPDAIRQNVSYLKVNIGFFSTNPLNDKQIEYLRQVRIAVADCRRIYFQYTKKIAFSTEASVRKVDPYSLVRLANGWLLIGYCHLRQDIRVFKLGRMDKLKILEERFNRPVDFKAEQLMRGSQHEVVVKVLIDWDVAHWAQETYPLSVVNSENDPRGLLLTLKVRDERDIIQWLLSWGKHLQVISPESLRAMMRQEIEKMSRKY